MTSNPARFHLYMTDFCPYYRSHFSLYRNPVSLVVEAVNDPPYLIAPLPDTTAVQDFVVPIEYVLTDYFADEESESLQFTVDFNSEEINAQIDGETLLLNSVPGWFGTTQIVVTADDAEEYFRNADNIVEVKRLYRSTCSDTFLVVLDEVSIDDDTDMVWDTMLYPAFPNPVKGEARISFSMREEGNAEVAVYNIRGQRVTTLASRRYGVGSHVLMWDCHDQKGCPVASGVYFVQMKAHGHSDIQKIMLLK